MKLRCPIDPSSLKMISKIQQKNSLILICENKHGRYILKALTNDQYKIFRTHQETLTPFANHFEYSNHENGKFNIP